MLINFVINVLSQQGDLFATSLACLGLREAIGIFFILS
jgi:hypothetical protein